jgi:RNA polymerase subunit RPABC4/transcription elongation factor Spt4
MFTKEKKNSNIICPVCGIENMVTEIPWNGDNFSSNEICPCCGTHYGEDDWADSTTKRVELHRQLREKWIKSGMKWWSKNPKYLDFVLKEWDPKKQLKNVPSRDYPY